jgi:hypothetical protein
VKLLRIISIMNQSLPFRLPIRRLLGAASLALTLLVVCAPSRVLAWGAMHGSITQSALSVLPAWQQEYFGDQKSPLINLYCMIPDLAQAPAYKKDYSRFVVLPNGDLFCHLPFKTRDKVAYQIKYYVEKTIRAMQGTDVKEAAHWAGCLLHYLEDSGSPAHTMPSDNQMGLIKDLLPVPDAFRHLPLHSPIEEGKLFISLAGYRPQLLGTSPEEVVSHLMERYNAMVRNARAQIIPILQGTFRGVQEEVAAGQMRAATMDAQVVADALYSMLCIAKDRFEAEEVAKLERIDLSSLTPNEVICQSYFPQHTYFSDPYFGPPLKNGILDAEKKHHTLVLNVAKEAGGAVAAYEVKQGLGLGTGCKLTYALPNNVYDQFDCLVGLHATLGKEGKVAFKVLADGKQIFESVVISGETPAQKVNLPIWGVKELVILTEGRSKVRGHSFAILAEPTLNKTKDAQKLQEAKTAMSAELAAPTPEQIKTPNRVKTE